MQRRDFLRTTLALGSSALLPGTGLAASCGLLNADILKPLEPIWDAAVNGHWDTVKEWLTLDPSLIHVRGGRYLSDQEETLLHLALDQNVELDLLKYLLSKGSDIHARSQNLSTPLHVAAWHTNVRVVNYLVSQGADIHAKDNSGTTPLHQAVSRSNTNIEVAQFLASRGADVNARDCKGKTPLLCLCLIGRDDRVEVIKLLVSYGADVNVSSENGLTPLRHMIQGCHVKEDIRVREGNRARENVEAVEYLICVGADVNATSKNGHTPLDFAEFLQRDQIMECLIRHGGVALKIY